MWRHDSRSALRACAIAVSALLVWGIPKLCCAPAIGAGCVLAHTLRTGGQQESELAIAVAVERGQIPLGGVGWPAATVKRHPSGSFMVTNVSRPRAGPGGLEGAPGGSGQYGAYVADRIHADM